MEKISCKICTRLLCRPVSTHCGHNFCLYCAQEHIKTYLDATPKCPSCNTKITRKYEINKSIESSLLYLFPKEYELRLQDAKIKLSVPVSVVWKYSIVRTTKTVLILMLPFITFAILSKHISRIPKVLLKVIKVVMKIGSYKSTSFVWQILWAIMHMIVKYIEATSVLSNITN